LIAPARHAAYLKKNRMNPRKSLIFMIFSLISRAGAGYRTLKIFGVLSAAQDGAKKQEDPPPPFLPDFRA